jgi:hypothetical protein
VNEEGANEEGAETSRPRVATADEENEAADSLEALRIDETAQSTVSDKDQGENLGRGPEIFCCRLTGSVVDPHHIDADPNSDHDPDADPDPDYHFDADPDPDFYLMRMRIRMRILVTKMMRIRIHNTADSDTLCLSFYSLHSLWIEIIRQQNPGILSHLSYHEVEPRSWFIMILTNFCCCHVLYPPPPTC